MTNAQILAILTGLSDEPRPLAELLPGATPAELRGAADYLNGSGLVGVCSPDGVLVADLSETGRSVVEGNGGGHP
jgi:hypothetical protein